MRDEVFEAVIRAMQPAEEIHGPDAADYIGLMQQIAEEAARRRDAAIAGMAEIRRTLVVSTAHLSPKIAAKLDSGDFSLTNDLEYGWEFYVGYPQETFMPDYEAHADDAAGLTADVLRELLGPVVALAKRHACTYVVFDQDGRLYDNLPAYEW